MDKSVILNQADIQRKIRRIAFQIYESNANESRVILAGIAQNGYFLAEALAKVLTEISDLDVQLCKVIIDKKDVYKAIETSLKPEDYKNQSLVLIDDVLHTGTTLIYGVKHFLEVPLKQFKTVVLIDRNHKKYPIKADFKGLSLSTSYQNHVEVVLDSTKQEVFLK